MKNWFYVCKHTNKFNCDFLPLKWLHNLHIFDRRWCTIWSWNFFMRNQNSTKYFWLLFVQHQTKLLEENSLNFHFLKCQGERCRESLSWILNCSVLRYFMFHTRFLLWNSFFTFLHLVLTFVFSAKRSWKKKNFSPHFSEFSRCMWKIWKTLFLFNLALFLCRLCLHYTLTWMWIQQQQL